MLTLWWKTKYSHNVGDNPLPLYLARLCPLGPGGIFSGLAHSDV